MITDLEQIKNYLDECIVFWRKKSKAADNPLDLWTALCNIDTFQSVRMSIFEEALEGGSKVTYSVKGSNFMTIDAIPTKDPNNEFTL